MKYALATLTLTIASAVSSDFWNMMDFDKSIFQRPLSVVRGTTKEANKWEMSGLYIVRIHQEQEEDTSEKSGVRMFKFRKIYDASLKKYRVDIHPVEGSGWENSYPATIIGDEDGANVVYESYEEQDEDVQCRHLRMPFRKCDLLRKAKDNGLTFEHDTLCRHWTGLNLGQENKEFGKVDVEYSELFTDAFTREPVSMYVEGNFTPKKHRGEGSGKSKCRFSLSVIVHEFTFRPDAKEEREELQWPSDVKKICKHGDVEVFDEVDMAAFELLNVY